MMMMIPMHVYKWTGSLQLLFVIELNSVSKVISDGIFNERF